MERLPIRVLALVEDLGTAGLSYTITIKARLKPGLSTSSLVVKIPIPLNTTSVEWSISDSDAGMAMHVREENIIVWK